MMKKRRILAIVLNVLMLLMMFASSISSQASECFKVSGSSASVYAGNQVAIDINLENNPGISAINLYYTYETQYFTLVKVENKVSSFTMTHELTTVWDAVQNYEENGKLATLTFDVAENTPVGDYEMTIHFLSAANENFETITAMTETAVVTVLPKTGTWKQDSIGWWYQNSDGTYPYNSWKQIDGIWYYFNAFGYMVTGWKAIGGTWYYFNGSGAMVTGWLNDDGTWYYFNESGAMVTGWLNDGGTWYYFAGSGAMVTGWKAIGGTWYYFHGSGAMVANQWVGNYYLQANGSMATNKWIGSYYVGADGCWIP